MADEEQPHEDVITVEPPPANGNGGTITEAVRNARESIPVGERGVTPMAYEHQVTIAKDRARAYLMLPTHLHNNAAVMAALVGIAARFNLDPIMLASQTYVQNNRLCFQSQAFGAILYGSGLLIGRLRFDFQGEGEEQTCTVSGRFKDDPDTTCSATTPTLKLLHPGHSKKEGRQDMVAGSPLWDKDPEQQLAYFGQRRWIRRYAPDACMGMYTAEEIAEIDEYRAETGGVIPLTSDRLGKINTGEGWGQGAHVDLDLASIEPELPPVEPEPEPQKPARKPAGAKKPVVKVKAGPGAKTRPGATLKAKPPSNAAVKAAVARAEAGPRKTVTTTPAWLDYVGKAESWIKEVDSPEHAANGSDRWEAEREARDKVNVPIGERSRLRALLDRKVAQFRPKEPQDDEAR